jgi:Protein of unknown function (DUF3034)
MQDSRKIVLSRRIDEKVRGAITPTPERFCASPGMHRFGVFWLWAALAASSVQAQPVQNGSGKLLLTGGVSSIDGAAGGGLTPWALVGSYADVGEWGGTAFLSRAQTQNYALNVAGVAVGIKDRVELSFAEQAFNANAVVAETTLKMDIIGIKFKLAGDAVLDSDRIMPQIALGAEFKHLNPGAAVGGVLDSVQAKRDGMDVYVSATKLFLAQGILVNGTLRATKANQNGLLGFGAVNQNKYRLKPELSLAYLLRKNVALGVEYRSKPNNLAFAGAAFEEDAWKDLFVAWALNKNISITAAYVDLGNIVNKPRQTGAYISAQLVF